MIFINIDSCWFIFLISSYALCLSQWDPSKLEFVSDGMVDSYFSIVDDEGWEDLKVLQDLICMYMPLQSFNE